MIDFEEAIAQAFDVSRPCRLPDRVQLTARLFSLSGPSIRFPGDIAANLGIRVAFRTIPCERERLRGLSKTKRDLSGHS